MIPLHLSERIGAAYIILHTRNKMRHCLGKMLAQRSGRSMILDQVDECHQELTIVDLAFDSKLGNREAMSRVDNIWEVHIALVELAEYVAGRLSRRSVLMSTTTVSSNALSTILVKLFVLSAWLEIFEKRTKDQVFGWL